MKRCKVYYILLRFKASTIHNILNTTSKACCLFPNCDYGEARVYCGDSLGVEVALLVHYVDDHDCTVAMAGLEDNLSVEVELVFRCLVAGRVSKGAKAYLGDILLGEAGLAYCYLNEDLVLLGVP